MLITAQQKNIRQTPRKLRLVANAVRKMPLSAAIQQLAVIERRATMPILKVVKQAIANAVNNHGLATADLELKDIRVNEGPRYRRFRAVSRGRAHNVVKLTSHVTVTLSTREVTKSATTTKGAEK
jgi:large subunit ribosomal protein L22